VAYLPPPRGQQTVPPTGGSLPGPDALSVGAVTFASNEAPNELAIGAGRDVQVVSERVGGSRVVASFGAQPDTLEWSGTLWQPLLSDKVAVLLSYMVTETEIPVTWRDQSYYGKIKSFKPTWRNANRCAYQITIEITHDANGAYSNASQQTLDAQVSTLLQGMQTLNGLLQNPPPTGQSQSQPGGAQAQVLGMYTYTAPAVVPLSASTFQSALTALQIAINGVPSVAGLTGTQLASIVAAANTAVAAVSLYVASQNGASAAFLLGSRLLNHLTLIQRNVQQGQSPRTVTVAGDTLWDVAAMYYGDYSIGFALAALNGQPSPIMPSGIAEDIRLLPGAV
jgi:hypothetical protein